MLNKLKSNNSLVLVIDLQDKLLNIIDTKLVTKVINNTSLLLDSASNLDIPIVITEHCKNSLGGTTKKLFTPNNNISIIQKTSFNCFGESTFVEALKSKKKKNIIITGMETHICVLQTALDLISLNYNVFILIDSVLSTTKLKWSRGLNYLDKCGCHLIPVESVLFQFYQNVDHPYFKTFIKKLKEFNSIQ
ncbi:MAG: isochorismatase family protein [Bdellovibrionales bacterium]|nr:isochorismatase family protein [Bdellovibrionales bacterium]